jgi:uncharacterized protein DUF4352
VTAKGSILAFVVLGFVVIAVGALALLFFVRHDQRAAVGEEIVYDDFGFRVRSVRNALEVGPPEARIHSAAGQSFVIVRFEVENHARRVEYDMSNHRAVLEDDAGQTFLADDEATRTVALETHAVPVPAKIRAGDYASSDLVYRIPDGTTGLQLRVKWTAEPIAGIDQAMFGDRAIVLQR